MPNKQKPQKGEQAHKQPNPQHLERVSGFSGPVPPPELLREYEELIPGLAERLVQMAENSLDAEVKLKAKALDVREQAIKSRDRQERQEHTDYRLGVCVALLVVFSFLSVAVFSIHKGAYAVASAVIAALAGIIWAVRRSPK